MADPITPRFMADLVVMQTVTIQFNQTWNGSAWVIDPANIELNCVGNLAESEFEVNVAGNTLTAADLPAAGQSALQDLFNYLEAQMAAKYG